MARALQQSNLFMEPAPLVPKTLQSKCIWSMFKSLPVRSYTVPSGTLIVWVTFEKPLHIHCQFGHQHGTMGGAHHHTKEVSLKMNPFNLSRRPACFQFFLGPVLGLEATLLWTGVKEALAMFIDEETS